MIEGNLPYVYKYPKDIFLNTYVLFWRKIGKKGFHEGSSSLNFSSDYFDLNNIIFIIIFLNISI